MECDLLGSMVYFKTYDIDKTSDQVSPGRITINIDIVRSTYTTHAELCGILKRKA
jgi:hypothetical protein